MEDVLVADSVALSSDSTVVVTDSLSVRTNTVPAEVSPFAFRGLEELIAMQPVEEKRWGFQGVARMAKYGEAPQFSILLVLVLMLNMIGLIFSKRWLPNTLDRLLFKGDFSSHNDLSPSFMEIFFQLLFAMQTTFFGTIFLLKWFDPACPLNILGNPFFNEVLLPLFGVMTGWFLLKFMLIVGIGWMFHIKELMSEIATHYLRTMSMSGLLMFMMTLLFFYRVVPLSIVQWGVVAIFALMLLQLFLYTLRYFYKHPFSILYLFLYLCAAEVIPAVVLVGWASKLVFKI